MKTRAVRVVCGAALALWFAGCATTEENYFRDMTSRANVYVAPVPSPIKKIAIMPFKAQTELIGISVSDLFVTEMLRAGRYELVERSQMAKVLSESELALAGLSAARAAEVGNMLGAEGVVIGTVDEYATVAQRGHPYPVVGMTARLIDCTSGKVMWSSDLAKRAGSKDTTLPEQARSVAHEIVAGLYQHWQVQPVTTRKVGRAPASPAPDQLVGRSTTPSSAVGERTAALPPAASRTSSAPLLAAPDFKVSDLGLREVVLTWGAPKERGLDYRIERSTTDKGPFAALGTVAAEKREYHDTGERGKPLLDSTAYFYRIVALSDRLESAPSPVKESLTAPPPEPPPAVKAEASASRKLKVTWDASPSEGVTKYGIERAPAAAPDKFVKLAEVKEPVFEEGGTEKTDLQDSTQYLYRITSINRAGAVGAPSPPAAVTTLPPPAAVGNLTARSGEVRCVPLAWAPSPEADVVRYDLFRRDAPDRAFEKIARIEGRAKTSFLDGGGDPGNLGDDREYAYRIRAINSVLAESADSEIVKAETRAAPPPVTGVKAKSGWPRAVPVAWEASPDEKVAGYEILRQAPGENSFTQIASVAGRETVSCMDCGGARKGLGLLQDQTAYRYQVVAFNTAHVRSAPSAGADATTKPAPSVPRELAASAGVPKAVRIVWRANPESDIACYVVEAAATAGSRFHQVARVAATAEAQQFAMEKDLGDGVARVYRLKAVDRDTLESGWSDSVAGASKPLPNAPAELNAAWDAGGVTLTWAAPPQTDIKCYKIWRKKIFGAEELATVTETKGGLTAAQAGKGLTVLVSAVDADGLESPRSAPLELVVPAHSGEPK